MHLTKWRHTLCAQGYIGGTQKRSMNSPPKILTKLNCYLWFRLSMNPTTYKFSYPTTLYTDFLFSFLIWDSECSLLLKYDYFALSRCTKAKKGELIASLPSLLIEPFKLPANKRSLTEKGKTYCTSKIVSNISHNHLDLLL